MPGFILLILLSVSPAVCETLYQWKNESGEVFYSNVSPPGEGCPYQLITMGRGEGSELSTVTDPSVGMRSLEAPAAAARFPHESSPESVMRLLNERITNRKNEISAMEQILRKQASDEGLRRSLMRKKRYLAEELIYLAELNP
ncbi:MAG: DUF4124 domain-containing protein [Pseudomonadota bacterium]